jgi:hypothetical protein
MVPLLIVPIFAGAAKIYIDMDIPEKKIMKGCVRCILFLAYLYLYSTLSKTFDIHRFKWDVPKLQQHQPQLLQLTPIEAVGQLYKVHEISQYDSVRF